MTFQLPITGVLLLSGLFLTATPKPMPLAAPVLLSPANGAVMDNGCQPKQNNVTWDFDWSDVPGITAATYHIRVWKNPAIPFINDMNVTSSSYHFDKPTGFVTNNNLTGWRWRVRAKVHGTWGPWSVARTFRVEKLNTDCP